MQRRQNIQCILITLKVCRLNKFVQHIGGLSATICGLFLLQWNRRITTRRLTVYKPKINYWAILTPFGVGKRKHCNNLEFAVAIPGNSQRKIAAQNQKNSVLVGWKALIGADAMRPSKLPRAECCRVAIYRLIAFRTAHQLLSILLFLWPLNCETLSVSLAINIRP